MNKAKIREKLKENTGDQLFIHCLEVERTAVHLAVQYGADSEKASIAGLLHDYAKELSPERQYRLAVENGLADKLALQEPALLHAPVGSWLLKEELKIDDEDILEAVRWHTTGICGMSLLARIVYLADCIEPGRAHPGLEEIREAAFSDLERALLGAVNLTIGRLLQKKKIIHPNSISFRNSLVLSLRKNNQG